MLVGCVRNVQVAEIRAALLVWHATSAFQKVVFRWEACYT